MSQSNTALTASLATLSAIDNPSRHTVLLVDIENTGAAPVTGWRLLGRIGRDAPLRDITPASALVADGYQVVAPAPRNPASLAAGEHTWLTLNVSLWDRLELQMSGAGAQVRAHWELLE